MNSKNIARTSAIGGSGSGLRQQARSVGALALALALGLPLGAAAQVPFATPEQAADALIEAVATRDQVAMPRLLGKDWRQLMPPEGVSADDREIFLDKARQTRTVNVTGGRGELVVGADAWPLPIPLVQGKDGQWRFDPRGGREAIVARTIGSNELSAMQAALAYIDAQREYAQADRNGDGMLEYAQKLVSSPGQRDGLIWSTSLDDESPMGEAFAPSRPGEGYHGYRFKILNGQGSNAKGGARSYLIGKRMSNGYALLAWPVSYGKTGVMSFMVNQDGQLFERDLGPKTSEAAASIKRFDPDKNWHATKP
ncbi:DUF2950 domain-containing protein [Rivibacter subsaxonicus]|uniref:DUF2950 family protein n=1 Tax=Rivibacter subsaxonicus TaxID=457575 RepID=A0A4Q7W0Q7_9BURK|nr:DUF2950 domain-containing protein [Rivibacter subsaxonicus]RZU02771.1 DUF2950 family protein [Rivibacter subsaxonicus]